VRLVGKRVVLRTGEPGDALPLTAILNEPTIAARWGQFDETDVASQFVGQNAALVITVDDEVIGAIQYEEKEDPMYRHAEIDIFVTVSRQGQRLGSDAIRTLSRHLFDERGHHRLTIDPSADNEQAIRAYQAVGFKPVGVMRSYERGLDGSWHDGLLMDMLAGELRER
jgi:aminoglycoside 6'-N-acetyltransferase